MAISRAFEIAELIRHFKYDSTNDVIVTEKRTQDKNKKRGAETKTSTSQFALDTFAIGHGGPSWDFLASFFADCLAFSSRILLVTTASWHLGCSSAVVLLGCRVSCCSLPLPQSMP